MDFLAGFPIDEGSGRASVVCIGTAQDDVLSVRAELDPPQQFLASCLNERAVGFSGKGVDDLGLACEGGDEDLGTGVIKDGIGRVG